MGAAGMYCMWGSDRIGSHIQTLLHTPHRTMSGVHRTRRQRVKTGSRYGECGCDKAMIRSSVEQRPEICWHLCEKWRQISIDNGLFYGNPLKGATHRTFMCHLTEVVLVETTLKVVSGNSWDMKPRSPARRFISTSKHRNRSPTA